MRWDVAVVGAGLFGSIIAAALRGQDRNVGIIDDAQPLAGSGPAACLMKPSWFSSMGKERFAPSLLLLDELYGVSDIRFKVSVGHATVHWCDPAKVLAGADITARVSKIRSIADGFLLSTPNHDIEAKQVVVAAGIWTPELVPVEGGFGGQAGMAFLWPEEATAAPYVDVWAPYKQLVVFNRGDGLWAGDGTAIKSDNWTDARAEAVEARCVKAAGNPKSEMKRLFGIRPYTKTAPCYLKEAKPGLWVATGGAKNGTIAAGWCAYEISRRMT